MPIVDLMTPTALFLHWGWLLVTRANAIVYILILAVFVLGAVVRLPRARRDIARVEAADRAADPPGAVAP